MLLAVDVGNTNITVGVYDGESLGFTARISTDSDRTGDQYAVEFMGIFVLYKCDVSLIDGAIVSSVAPAVTNSVCSAISKVVNVDPILVGPGIKTGLNIAINDLNWVLICCVLLSLHLINIRFRMRCVISARQAQYSYWIRTEK